MFKPNFTSKLDNKEELEMVRFNGEYGDYGSFYIHSRTIFRHVNIIQLFKCVSKEHLNKEYPFYNCVLNDVLIFSSSDCDKAKEVYDAFSTLIDKGIDFYEFDLKKMLKSSKIAK